MKRDRTKYGQIVNIHGLFLGMRRAFVPGILASALLVSAKGTKHYFEALELICECIPEEVEDSFHKELSELKAKEAIKEKETDEIYSKILKSRSS